MHSPIAFSFLACISFPYAFTMRPFDRFNMVDLIKYSMLGKEQMNEIEEFIPGWHFPKYHSISPKCMQVVQGFYFRLGSTLQDHVMLHFRMNSNIDNDPQCFYEMLAYLDYLDIEFIIIPGQKDFQILEGACDYGIFNLAKRA